MLRSLLVAVGIGLNFASFANAEETGTPPAEQKPDMRGSVGTEGVQPDSKLYQAEERFRKERQKQTEQSARQMPGTVGVKYPRPGYGDFDTPEQSKSRANRTKNRIKPEMDPTSP